MIPLSIPNFEGNELKYVTDAVGQGWVSTGGAYITQMEEKMAEYAMILKGSFEEMKDFEFTSCSSSLFPNMCRSWLDNSDCSFSKKHVRCEFWRTLHPWDSYQSLSCIDSPRTRGRF